MCILRKEFWNFCRAVVHTALERLEEWNVFETLALSVSRNGCGKI